MADAMIKDWRLIKQVFSHVAEMVAGEYLDYTGCDGMPLNSGPSSEILYYTGWVFDFYIYFNRGFLGQRKHFIEFRRNGMWEFSIWERLATSMKSYNPKIILSYRSRDITEK